MNINQIARKANVSRSTVSRVINNHPRVSEETRRTVLRVMDEAQYIPNAAARSLASKRSHIIGMLAYNITHPFWSGIFGGVDRYISQETDYGIFLSNSKSRLHVDDHKKNYKRNLKNLVARGVDGVIIALANPLEHEDIDFLEASGTPYVIIQNQLDDSRAISVNVDNRGGSATAARHLVSLGHKRIIHAAGPMQSGIAYERCQGFMAAMRESDLPFDDSSAPLCGFLFDEGYRFMKNMIEAADFPTAILFVNDSSAFGAYLAANEAGINIPGDISFVGFDHLTGPMDISGLLPDLTTMIQPVAEMGGMAAKLLMDQLDNRKVETFNYVLSLHLGATTARRRS